MFSGIVQAIGSIVQVEELGGGRRLLVEAPALDLDDVAVGASIAVNGACMTVTARTPRGFAFDLSGESLSKTAGLAAHGEVNLEKSLRLGDRIDGHLVSGHVDGTGTVQVIEPHGESWQLVVRAPLELAPYFAYKGSITVHGVSLTINRVDDQPQGCDVWINLIPHTVAMTTLRLLRPGARVNLEVDMLARYVHRMLSQQALVR